MSFWEMLRAVLINLTLACVIPPLSPLFIFIGFWIFTAYFGNTFWIIVAIIVGVYLIGLIASDLHPKD